MKSSYFRVLAWCVAVVTGITLLAGMGFAGAYVYLSPTLPSAEDMRTVELQVPLRVYTRSGQLIAQIGEQRRIPVSYAQIPEVVKQAFLAAEDDRFFEHHGIDYAGVLRSATVNLFSGSRAQGASTITMQAARNMFLSQRREVRRKLQEVFLTYRMERQFSKEQILALYLNVIFFGQRSYGIAAAAETYFGKPLGGLTVGEAALLAGIPKAPTDYNPVADPERAQLRRTYVVRRMLELGYIDEAQATAANAEVVSGKLSAPLFDVDAPYVAEMARLEIVRRYGEAAQDAGYKVYTTIDSRLQAAANRAVRLGLLEYDRRQGWRGPVDHIELGATPDDARIRETLARYEAIAGVLPAIVTQVGERDARVAMKYRGPGEIGWEGLSWARRVESETRMGPAPKTAADVLAVGDVVYVMTDGRNTQLVQIPEAQSALVAVDPDDGAIAALVGGFDYYSNKFNRATQAKRQPGSGFKPFIYSAALDNGFTPASLIIDAPIVMDDPSAETSWRPENSSGEFGGPTRLREALVRSRNLVSIRLLREIGTGTAIDYAARFGFVANEMPQNLTLALGTLQTTPLEMATGFAVFANGGYRVEPYIIDRIEIPGQETWHAQPVVVCESCDRPPSMADAAMAQASFTNEASAVLAPAPIVEEFPVADDTPEALRELASREPLESMLPAARVATRAITPQNCYIMDDMMADVIQRGTGRRALALNRRDIAGKTGTTNDSKDAWFNGFHRDLVATVWVGYDQERSLGEREEGSRTAVPIWVYFMREALRAVPQYNRPMPPGIMQARISPYTGELARPDDPDAISEMFRIDRLPEENTALPGLAGVDDGGSGEPLF